MKRHRARVTTSPVCAGPRRRALAASVRGLPLALWLGAGLLGAGLWGAGCKTDEAEPEPRIKIDAERYRAPLFDDDVALGGDTPLVTLVVFTDYACPPCARTWMVMDHLVEHFGEDIRVVFRSYTVPGFGKGEQAIDAAFAAGAQDKFWEMHRQLFSHIGEFERPTLRAHAQQLGLDVPRFMDDLDTGTGAGQRIRHRREAARLGIVGLPVVFVNGLYVAGYADEETWRGIVNEEIARAKEMMAAGTPRQDLYTAMMNAASTKRVGPPQGSEELRADLDKKQAALEAPKALSPPRADARYLVEPGPSQQSAPQAPVLVVEFIDFQCPYCKRAWSEELAELKKTRGEQVSFAVRHLPLEIHASARGAAKASLAAAKQDGFWVFHDALMAHSGELGRDVFEKLAAEAGLDAARFVKDFDDPALDAEVDADVDLANRLGVDATPGYFVNGRFVSGFRAGRIGGMVDEELEIAKEHEAAGLRGAAVRAKIMAGAIGPDGFPNQGLPSK